MSMSLRHFPQFDPAPRNIAPEKLNAQAEIDAATAEYLALGGEIQEVGSEANRNPQFMIGCIVKADGKRGRSWWT